MKEFEKVYLEYYDTVYQYVLSLCRDPALAEDVTQEAFFKALKQIDRFRGECKLSVWLCQIAKNTFYTEAQKRKRETNEIPMEILPAQNSIAENLDNKEQAFEIQKVVHTLEEPYKEVFWMRTFGEMQFKKIAEIFNKTESWARVTYHRAKIKIREGIL